MDGTSYGQVCHIWTPNGLEMSRPASAHIVSQTRFAAAGRVGSIELLGSLGLDTEKASNEAGGEVEDDW